MTAYERLEVALDGGIRRGMARCPAHDDTTASLSVKDDGGKVLVHCHAGCPADAVLEALGWSAADLFDEPPPPRRDAEVIATYAYADERGTPLFYVERRAGKRFLQYRLDAAGRKVWDLDGVRRVPYHLKELLDGIWAGGTAYVVEGEKDVHAIEAAGGVATCNPGGAGKWRPEYAGHFRGADRVVVVADIDTAGQKYAGQKHAAQVAESLRQVVEAVELVEAAEGKDAADHLAAGHGLGDFRPADPAPPARLSTGEKSEESEKRVRVPPPVSDPAMYRGILAEITGAAEPTTEADPSGIYASLQSGAGVLAGRGPYVQIGNVRHPLLIWSLLMGRTGSGRKGEATTTSEVFLYRAKPSTFPGLAIAGLSSGEGLIEQVRDDGPRADDQRLLVTETEFSSVMARSRREGNTLAAISRQAWEGRALSVMNRKQLKASASHIAIIGHVAPREFRLRLADAELAGGTYNRYLPHYVERGKLLAVPEPVAETVLARLAGRLSDAIDAAAEVECITLGPAAISLWTDELYPEFADLDDEDDLACSEFTRRAAPYCLRIAGLHAALDGRALIGKDDLIAASAQIRYSVASARYVLDGVRRDPREDRLMRAIDAAGQAGLTRTQISGLFSRKLPAGVLDELLAGLTANGEYEVIRAETGGRPVETYRRTSFA